MRRLDSHIVSVLPATRHMHVRSRRYTPLRYVVYSNCTWSKSRSLSHLETPLAPCPFAYRIRYFRTTRDFRCRSLPHQGLACERRRHGASLIPRWSKTVLSSQGLRQELRRAKRNQVSTATKATLLEHRSKSLGKVQ